MSEEKDLSKGQKSYLKRIINDFKKDANVALKEIEEIRVRLIEGSEDEDSILEIFKEAESDLGKSQSKINKIYNDIFESSGPNEKSLAEDIRNFTSQFEEEKDKIEDIKNEIEEYRDELFGYESEDEKIIGIKDKVDEEIERIKQLYKENEERQNALFDKIEGLLKGASTVALAKAFKDHKDSFKMVNRVWMSVFILSILAMMCISVWSFVNMDYDLKDMWKYTLGNLPFLGGAIWLAIYASKQRSQNKRLQQEYAFKEDVAKIYYGLKKEVEELSETDLGVKLNESMLTLIMDVVSQNPSETLDSKSHNDRGPILEALNNISQLLKKN